MTPQHYSDYLKIIRKNNIGKECLIVIQKFLEWEARDYEFYYIFKSMTHKIAEVIFGVIQELEDLI